MTIGIEAATKAGRMQIVLDLISPRPIYSDCGCIIGEDEPLITLTSEQIKELLEV